MRARVMDALDVSRLAVAQHVLRVSLAAVRPCVSFGRVGRVRWKLRARRGEIQDSKEEHPENASNTSNASTEGYTRAGAPWISPLTLCSRANRQQDDRQHVHGGPERVHGCPVLGRGVYLGQEIVLGNEGRR
jgi:hypothetical protein